MADGPGEPGGRTIEALSRQLVAARAEREEARAERDEAQAQQAALAEVLLAISRSAGNLKQVFDTLVDRAVTLCAAAGGELVTFEDDLAIAASLRNVRPALAEFWRTPQRIAGTNLELVRRSGRTIHRPDMREVEGYQKRVPLAVAGVELGGIRTFLQVPLKNEHEVLGLFMIFRHEVRPFSDRQVALVEAFANQAAIAMENARLLAGQREALERQTATAEILAVINASPGNLTPVFDAILDKARRLCDAAHGDLWTYDGEMLHLAASHGEAGFAAWLKAQGPVPVWPGSPTEALLKGADHVQYEDPIRDGHFEAVPEFLAQVEAAGVRSTLFVPMWKDGVLLGVVIVYRREVRRFADAQVRVLQGFADQAVVAMENARLLGEQREALEQQTATAEVLEAINASPGSLEPVFGTMLDKAMRLCEAAFGIFGRFDGELFEPIVDRGVPPELIESTRRIQSPPPGSGLGRLAAGESVVQLVDLANTEIYRAGFVGARALVDIGGARTAIFVALRKDGVLRGVIVMYRREVRAFSAKQVALLQNFAAQAVIAMENARLLTEQREALERQTATADILRVISQSPTDASPVFEAIADSALRLLDGWSVVVWRLDGDVLRPASIRGGAPDSAGAVEVTFPTLPRGRSFVWEALDRRAAVCISDVEAEGTDPDVREVARRRGWRANAAVPMLRDGEPLGVVAVSRVRPGPFAARELALLESFAAQAVIAIENVRLFTELQKRTDDLTESLDYQTATSELLEVVTRSAADIQPVLDAMLASAARLCEAGIGGVVVKQGEEFWYRALQGGTPELFPALSARPIAPEPGTVAGQTLLTRDVVHVADIHAYPDYAIPQVLKEVRTALGVPLLREGELLGAIVLTRDRVEPFSERQIALVKTFADQAVIALENARLLTELRESLDRQTATAEILRVINASPGDLTPVFDAILEKAHSVCGADMGSLFLRDGANFRAITTMGYDAAIDAMLRQSRPPIPAMAALIEGQRFHHLADLQADDGDGEGTAALGPQFKTGSRIRTNLIIPLRKDDAVLGFISANRREVRPYSDKEIALLENFAAQAVIAIENARLLGELRDSLEQQTATADILRVISQSPTDVMPVLNVVAGAARRFCGADDVVIGLREGEELAIAAHEGPLPRPAARRRLDRTSSQGRAVIDGRTVHNPDMLALDPAEWSLGIELARTNGFKSALAVPMLRDGRGVGTIMLRRPEAGPFSPRQIALAEAFADQAVIAIENVRLFTELQRALDEQTASAEVLRVISQSPTDAQPALHAIVAAARRFCNADDAILSLREGDEIVGAAFDGPFGGRIGERHKFDPGGGQGRIIASGRTTHFPDVLALDPAEYATAIAFARQRGHRAALGVPLLRDGVAIGALSLRKAEPGPFSDRQISLLETFAAQAVIAIENVRLFTELRESLDQQTASAEVLRVISQSPTDVGPVLDAVAAAARRFCGAEDATIILREGDELVPTAHEGSLPTRPRGTRDPLNRTTVMGRAIVDRDVVHVPDVEALDPVDYARAREIAGQLGWRAALATPMLRDGEAIGCILLRRPVAGAFTPRQIELLKTFASQAVIAIENVRLFTELRESLEYQTATSELLEVISRSTADIQPVLDTMLASAARLCGVAKGDIAIRSGEAFAYAASLAPTPDELAWLKSRVLVSGRANAAGRALLERRAVQVVDQSLDAELEHPDAVRKPRTVLAVPLLREDEPIGVITLLRDRVEAFSEREIALIRTFADQAVIAMENARLLSELTQRTEDLTESLEYQTATSELLEVISRSAADVQPVLDAMLAAAGRLCGIHMGGVAVRQGDVLRYVATLGMPDGYDRFLRETPHAIDRGTSVGRAVVTRQVVHIPDVQADPDYAMTQTTTLGGFRSLLAVPLMREGEAVGAIALGRTDSTPLSERQIALVRTFADQAVIAMENARLLTELRESLDQQTAMAEVLGLINSSAGDIAPVFDTMVERAMTLCEAPFGHLLSWDGEFLRGVSTRHAFPDTLDLFSAPIRIAPDMPMGRVLQSGKTRQIVDTAESEGYLQRVPAMVAIVEQAGIRTLVSVPLVSERGTIGLLSLYRREVRPFTDKQIALVESFAAQAVVAMENARLLTELRESLDQQTATSEILRVIAQSPTDVSPVLEAVARAALRFCGAEDVAIDLREGEIWRCVAHAGILKSPLGMTNAIGRKDLPGRTMLDRVVTEIPDVEATTGPETEFDRGVARQVGFRAALSAPMMRQDEAVGALILHRTTPGAFSARQIELLESFAAQAVIAIENVRLFTELRESLDQQTAMAEVLGLINSSAGDITPVFDAMVDKATALCEAPFGALFSFDGQSLRAVSTRQSPQDPEGFLLGPIEVPPQTSLARTLSAGIAIQEPDLAQSDAYRRGVPLTVFGVEQVGIRTMVMVPLMSERGAIGVFTLYRLDVRPFTDKQVALVEAFAAQAVVAMENARLLGELTRREEELRVTFDHMGDGVVMFDAGLKLASWNRNFQELLDVPDAFLAARPGLEDYVRLLVERGELGAGNADEEVGRYRQRANEAWSAERTRPDGRVIEVRNNPVPGGGAVLIYADITERKKAEAAIAAARDAAEAALERQTATADILKVIASSPADTRPAFEAIAESANRLLGGLSTAVWRFDGDVARLEAFTPVNPEADAALRAMSPLPLAEIDIGAAVSRGGIAEMPDTEEAPAAMRDVARLRGFRALLFVPLMTQGKAIGFVSVTRREPGTFAADDVRLLQTFADQAVIAIENARLFNDLRDSLERLKAAQANLVQSEKMATLGQLTAGIAHEIKNPLNFVNNFATLSVDLLDELKEVAGPALATLDGERRAELDETMELLTGNLGKIAEHGKRADGIVRSMLSHSRGGAGDWAPSDINALVEEALNLAYHGARAQDKEFNVTLERDLETGGRPIEVVPQDVTRVFLNLFGNGFYAANKRRLGAREPGFRPTIRVTTRDTGDGVEVRVRDNGTGIPPEVRDKLFQPFFTTKPTGEGTGLGLSISYDIVTQQHGGTIAVESEVGQFTEFTVRLPRARRVAAANGN